MVSQYIRDNKLNKESNVYIEVYNNILMHPDQEVIQTLTSGCLLAI